MAGPYTYLGGQILMYQAYMDEATSKMLTAEPGGAYSMISVEDGLAVPPPDGRWAEAAPPPPPAPAPVVVAPDPEPAPEGGV